MLPQSSNCLLEKLSFLIVLKSLLYSEITLLTCSSLSSIIQQDSVFFLRFFLQKCKKGGNSNKYSKFFKKYLKRETPYTQFGLLYVFRQEDGSLCGPSVERDHIKYLLVSQFP